METSIVSQNAQHVIHVDFGRAGTSAALLLAHVKPLTVNAVKLVPLASPDVFRVAVQESVREMLEGEDGN